VKSDEIIWEIDLSAGFFWPRLPFASGFAATDGGGAGSASLFRTAPQTRQKRYAGSICAWHFGHLLERRLRRIDRTFANP
jgi:hypothetical protein